MPEFTPREEGWEKNIEPHVVFGNFSIKKFHVWQSKTSKNTSFWPFQKDIAQEKNHWSEILTPHSTN